MKSSQSIRLYIKASGEKPEIQAMEVCMPFHYAPQPNCRLNADAKTGHAFGILLARFGAMRASRSGAGQPGR